MPAFIALIFLPLLLQQRVAFDETQARFYEAMELASTEGIPSLVRRLEDLTKAAPSSPYMPYVHETILMIGLLHPGSVPDRAARLEQLKASATANPDLAKVLKRIDILQSYYFAAMNGHPEGISDTLTDPEGSPYRMQALADAALRAQDYEKAAILALQVIESDQYSPLLSNTHMVLGLSSAYRGDYRSALMHFQHAYAASSIPTIYGNPRDFLYTTYRFAKPAASPAGTLFDEVDFTRLAGTELKDPQALVLGDKGYILVDKEMMLTVSRDGKVLEKKPARKIEDAAISQDGRIYSLMRDSIDLGFGSAATLSLTIGKKTKRLSNLRSLAVGIGGDLYFVDEDEGLLRGSANETAGSLSLTKLAPIKARLVRTDRWGNLYALADDQKSILVFSREGKPLTSVSPASAGGKSPVIEYFAFDSLNHLYMLESSSVQVFAIVNGISGFQSKQLGTYSFDQRPQFRNLRVLGVDATGELALTGKNESNWVRFR